MKDIGLLHYLLGLKVWQGAGEVFLGQGKHITEILKRFQMLECKPLITPMVPNLKLICDEDTNLVDPTLYLQLIGSLMYLVNTRPNVFYAVNTLNKFMVEPCQSHWKAGKHVLRYLKGTIQYGMVFWRW
jgi:hypothetical protein